MKQRKLSMVVNAQPSSDGDGVKINRLAGRDLNVALDPFLLIDEIRSEEGADYIGGFPSHPHRGFETITYMKQGRMRHKDHMGNEGLLEGGDVQWMTAGRGVIHSEMPEQSEGLLHGFQLWLNLPADKKMQPAAYADYPSQSLPMVDLGRGSQVKIIAGSFDQQSSPTPQADTEAIYWDVTLAPNASMQQSLPEGHHVAVYVYQGEVAASQGMGLKDRQLGLYTEGECLHLQAGDQGLQALVIAGKPLKEPIAQYGPFVMNTAEQIDQAINDYRAGRLIDA